MITRMLHAYRQYVTQTTPPCPQTPSCSEYALASVERYGPWRGAWMAYRRVRLCGK